MSGQFMAANRNKRSIAIDLKTAGGAEVLRRLVARADALVTNIRPAALERLGFGYEACKALNPKIIYAAATGFGQDGPWAKRPAFDEIVQASSGLASSIGSDEEPAFVPSLVGDKLCGLALAGAVAAALVYRERTGKGQLVECRCWRPWRPSTASKCWADTPSCRRSGRGIQACQGAQAVKTRDGWLTMLPYSGENWCTFFETVGHPECIEEFSVRDPIKRAANIDAIYARMKEIALERTTAEWEELLLRIDVPHASFAKMTEIGEQPHLKAVGLFQKLEHPTEGTIQQARPPARFSESPAAIHRLPPRLGEHTREILAEVGYSDSDIDALVDAKAIGESAPA
jgi:crotonobetainyl-CoA:carnitine CoA-transferase CaiB-like acyl-CoA transferase